MRTLLALSLPFAIASGCRSETVAGPPTAEEYAVLSSVISKQVPGTDRFVIVEEATIGNLHFGAADSLRPKDWLDPFRDSIPGLHLGWLRKLDAANTRAWRLAPRLGLQQRYMVLSDSALRISLGGMPGPDWGRHLREQDWRQFRERERAFGGIVQLSRPAFSRNRRYALVFATVTRGHQDGRGDFFMLQMNDGHWDVIGRSMYFVQ